MVPKQSHYERCPALGLWSNSLCVPWTKKFGVPCSTVMVAWNYWSFWCDVKWACSPRIFRYKWLHTRFVWVDYIVIVFRFF